EPTGGGSGEPAREVKTGEQLYVWLTAKQCANNQPFSAWVTPAGTDAVRSPLRVSLEFDWNPGESCAKRFKGYGFSFPEPGSYDFHFVLGEAGSANGQPFVIRYSVTDAGATGNDAKWEDEPAGSLDWCNNKPCNEVIEAILLDS